MKRNSKKITSLVFLSLILLCSMCLTSCGALTSILYSELFDFAWTTPDDFYDEDYDAPVLDGSDQETGEPTIVPGDITNNEITITGGTEGLEYATAKGLQSTVSIYCKFQKTTGGYFGSSPSTQTYYSTGSGVIYTLEEGGSAFIITNFHVVYEADSDSTTNVSEEMYIYLYGRENEKSAIPAVYVGGSAQYDIAVLRVNNSEILRNAMSAGSVAAVCAADSDKVVPGQTSIAIGNPSTTAVSGISVTKGVVSVDSEYITMSAADGSGSVDFRVIRTDTAVNPGNSGGGLYNSKGELIGIVNAKTASSEADAIGYAIPSNVATGVADNIIAYCYGKECKNVMRAILGLSVMAGDQTTEYLVEEGIILRRETITVSEVTKGGLAESILKVGDVIKSVKIGSNEEKELSRQFQLIDTMLDARVGDTVAFTIVRGGTETTVSTVLTQACLTAY